MLVVGREEGGDGQRGLADISELKDESEAISLCFLNLHALVRSSTTNQL